MDNMFSKRHYIAIAQCLRDSKVVGKYEIAQELAQMFQRDNERFSFSKFSKAAGILQSEGVKT
jgi:ribosomal protein S24E